MRMHRESGQAGKSGTGVHTGQDRQGEVRRGFTWSQDGQGELYKDAPGSGQAAPG